MTASDPNPQSGPTVEDESQGESARGLRAASDALHRWAEILSAGRIDDLLALYAPDAILVPTLSDAIRDREDGRRRYFENFLADGTPRCTIDHESPRISGKLSTVVIGGIYTFTFQRDGRRDQVPARFLFTYEQIQDRWLITGHHSSRLTRAD